MICKVGLVGVKCSGWGRKTLRERLHDGMKWLEWTIFNEMGKNFIYPSLARKKQKFSK